MLSHAIQIIAKLAGTERDASFTIQSQVCLELAAVVPMATLTRTLGCNSTSKCKSPIYGKGYFSHIG
jgi:hypothetical protein